MDMHMTRRREPREFFGLERQLWDDRHDGALYERYLDLLTDTRCRLAAALMACAADATDTARMQAMLHAVEAATDVLDAAHQAVLGFEAPAFGPAAGAGYRLVSA